MHPAADLTPAELRSFGLVLGGMFALVFGLGLPWLFGRGWPLWPWVVCGTLAAIAVAAPALLAPVHRTWMRVGAVLGRINTRILLALAFVAVFVPTAAALRILRRDAMRRRRDPGAATYRETSRVPPRDHMERPY